MGLLLAARAGAQQVPPWQDGVLHEVPTHVCPRLAHAPDQDDPWRCARPGRLALASDATGRRFIVDDHAGAPAWIALPGEAPHWPDQVRLDGQPAVVPARDEQPMMRMARGDHRLQRLLPWSTRPSGRHMPEAIGLVDLALDGKPTAETLPDA